MANYTFTTYWVEGTKEAVHQLHDAIANAEGWTSKAFKNLGINTEGKEDEYSGWFRAEWCNPKVEDKDDYSVLQFEEYYPWERGTMMPDLFEEERFEGKLTHLYYYAEELENYSLSAAFFVVVFFAAGFFAFAESITLPPPTARIISTFSFLA